MPNIKKFESRVWISDEISTLYRVELNMDTGNYTTYATTVWPGCFLNGRTHNWESKFGPPLAFLAEECVSKRHFSVKKFTPIKGVSFRKCKKESTNLK